jgi:NADH-quinone oxidoreductase subunit J
MHAVLFHVFAFFTVFCAIATVINRNAVSSAMAFLLSLTGIAALFVLLDAFLLAVVLVLVYAGAVVALFLFIIMLLNMGGERRPLTRPTMVAGILAGALIVLGLVSFARGAKGLPASLAEDVVPLGASLKGYAEQLFTLYLLPVQIVGFLLLVAMLGVIVLSKKFPELEDVK